MPTINSGPIITPDGSPIVISAPAANITHQGLTAFQNIVLFGYGFTHDGGGGASQSYLLQLHQEGGAWITAGYLRNGSANAGYTNGWAISGSADQPAATVCGWYVVLSNFNLAVPTSVSLGGGREQNATSNTQGAPGYLAASVAYDGYRIIMSAGGNIATGTLIPQAF